MALHHNPRIVTDGLVLALDAADVNSYQSGSTSWNNLANGQSNGVLVNSPDFISDNGNSYLETDGTDSILRIPGDGQVDFGVNDNFTIESWFNLQAVPSSGNTSAICVKDNRIGIDWYYPAVDDLYVRVGVRNDVDGQQSFGSYQNVNLNQWYNVVFTYVPNLSDGMKMYINGEFERSTTNVGFSDFSDPTRDYFIGSNSAIGGTNVRGNIQISNIKMYRKTLTASEVLQNYNATKNRFKNTSQNAITEVSGYAFKIDAANPSSYPGSGTTVTSVGSETFTSTLYGATYSSEGGGSFLFDGTDDIAISDISNFNVASMSFSVDTWFKFASSIVTGSTDDTHAFIGGGGWGGTGDAWHLGGKTYGSGYEEIDFTFFGDGATGQFPASYDEQEWNHYCGTYSISTGKAAVYLNGVQISIEDSTYISRTAMPLEWGAVIYSANTSNGIREYYQHGYIGPARIWKNKELSEEEVLQNYNAAKTRFGL